MLNSKRADIGAEPGLRVQRGKRLGTIGKWEANVIAIKHAKCQSCGTPNQSGISVCSNCGEAAPDIEIREVPSAVTDASFFPWYARWLMEIGIWLRSLHDKLSGDKP